MLLPFYIITHGNKLNLTSKSFIHIKLCNVLYVEVSYVQAPLSLVRSVQTISGSPPFPFLAKPIYLRASAVDPIFYSFVTPR